MVQFAYGALTIGNLELGLVDTMIFLLGSVVREEYSFANYLQLRGHAWRCFSLWSLVSLLALAIAFLSKAVGETSRAVFVLTSTLGFVALFAERAMLTRFIRSSAASGGVSARRLFLVGFEKDIEAFTYRYKPWTCGMTVAASVVLRETEHTLDDDLTLAAASARMLRPDDVFILSPWSRTDVIDKCVTAFLRVPARIHLGPERVLDRFANAHIDKIGAISSLSLSGDPLNLFEVAAKRAFDIVASALALVALSPALLLCALAIRLDSRGPALFYQRRYGFNRQTFRIVKLRTMTTMDDGRDVRQATANDPRVTPVGRILRRYNIDELPQLFNVLRGEIDSPEKIRQRIEHDLYYIDNWSLPLDLWIVFLTVFSRKAYRNAV